MKISFKGCAVSFITLMITSLFGVTMTYAIIPTFLPAIAGTPAAWAYTILATLAVMIMTGLCLLIIARGSGD